VFYCDLYPKTEFNALQICWIFLHFTNRITPQLYILLFIKNIYLLAHLMLNKGYGWLKGTSYHMKRKIQSSFFVGSISGNTAHRTTFKRNLIIKQEYLEMKFNKLLLATTVAGIFVSGVTQADQLQIGSAMNPNNVTAKIYDN